MERGYTLEGAKIHIKERQQKDLTKYEIISKLEHIKSELQKIKKEL